MRAGRTGREVTEGGNRASGRSGRHRSQPGGTPARRASSSMSAIALVCLVDVLLDPVELGERLLPIPLDDGALRRDRRD